MEPQIVDQTIEQSMKELLNQAKSTSTEIRNCCDEKYSKNKCWIWFHELNMGGHFERPIGEISIEGATCAKVEWLQGSCAGYDSDGLTYIMHDATKASDVVCDALKMPRGWFYTTGRSGRHEFWRTTWH